MSSPSYRTSPRLNVKKLKEFAYTNLPRDSTLRDLILGERDELEVYEFLAKMDVWQRPLRRESLS